MTREEALSIVGNRPSWELKAMKKALRIHQWLNTPEENRRLFAVSVLLRGVK